MRAVANLSFMFSEAGSSLAARCTMAAGAGFHAIECNWPGTLPALEFKKALDECGLKPVLMNCYQGDTDAGECGFAAEQGQEERFLSSLNCSMEYATAIGCGKLHILSGRDQGAPAEQEKVLTANLQKAVPVLQQRGLVAVIEPINPVSKPGYFLSDVSTAARVVTAVDSPAVRLQLDIFHLQMIAGNVTNNIRKLLPITAHVQVAQAPHRHEPSCPGELDYQYVFSALRDAGYDGDVGCEYMPSGATSAGLAWVGECGLHF